MTTTVSSPPRDHRPPTTTSSDGSREYDPRKDPKIIGIAVIVFGTLIIALAGVGSTPVMSGDGSGTVFPFQDINNESREEVALALEVNRSSLRPGGAVLFNATYENGTPASSATLSVGGSEYSFDDSGRATVTFEGGGSYTATIRKENTESVRYVADGTILSVERYKIPLAVSANATNVTAGDAVRFAVRRADTDAPVTATISVAGRTLQTDQRGHAVARIERAGHFEAVARRDPTAAQRYVSDSVSVSAERQQVRLAIAMNRSAPRPGETVRLTLFRTDTGATIDGNLTVGNRSLRTVDGAVTVSYDRAGQYQVRGTTTNSDSIAFEPVEQTLRVYRYAAPVSLSANETTVESGESVRFTAVRSDTGEPLPGQLTVGNRTYWLDQHGEATVEFTQSGTVTATATRANTSTHRFPADELTVTVKDTEYRLGGVEAPESVNRNASATIAVDVSNRGSDMGAASVTYRFDGATVDTETVVLRAGQRATVEFAVPTETPAGTYDQTLTVRGDAVSASIEIRAGDASA
ncbi:CARDB protein [Natronoarchaeum philippinense]|uniref:CARDB protein n=1 Tax=Natronoarchaeum philippinense TaxID=558529 RepID=A0A285N7X1_NATPI|nr:CARDB domain-containing protein [Natronoarchaeum philippinense]SNZ05584.1 CARDB protein [Natronoarchaeum philippinense]